jgi:hypothetical protein
MAEIMAEALATGAKKTAAAAPVTTVEMIDRMILGLPEAMVQSPYPSYLLES